MQREEGRRLLLTSHPTSAGFYFWVKEFRKGLRINIMVLTGASETSSGALEMAPSYIFGVESSLEVSFRLKSSLFPRVLSAAVSGLLAPQ